MLTADIPIYQRATLTAAEIITAALSCLSASERLPGKGRTKLAVPAFAVTGNKFAVHS